MTTKEILARFDEIERTRRITLADIEVLDVEFLIPAVIGRYEKCGQYYVSVAARDGKLPYPFIRSGNRTKIPKAAYIEFHKGLLKGERL